MCDPAQHLVLANTNDIADICHELIYVTNAYVSNSCVTNSLCIPIGYTMGITDSHVCDPDKYLVHVNANDIADINITNS